MSKTASPALYELIKSLTKSEKRYFKIYASRHTIGTKNNGIKIFDFIDQQSEFDDNAIHKHFKGATFLNRFSITKKRLYEQIISALDAFHSTNNIDAQLYKMLHGIKILYSKGLYNHTQRELIKTKRLAKKHNNIPVLLQLANEEKKLIETKGYHNFHQPELEKHVQEAIDLAKQQRFYNELWHVKSQLFILLDQYGQARSKKRIEEYNDIFNTYKNIEHPQNLSFEEQYLMYHFESAYYFAILEHDQSLELLKQNLELFKNHQDELKKCPNKYFSILTNIIHLEAKKGNTKALHTYLNELKVLPQHLKTTLTEDLTIKLFSSINSIELKLYNQEGNYSKAIALADTIEAGLNKHASEINPSRKAYLAFNMAVAYFGNDEFNQSLKWINLILNSKGFDQSEDIVSFAHLLNLLIHFELDNKKFLYYAIKSTKHFLMKRKRTFKFETIFLKHISKITNAKDKFETETLLRRIEGEIEELQNDPFESIAFEYFDFHTWLISKIKNKPFCSVKRAAFLKQSA